MHVIRHHAGNDQYDTVVRRRLDESVVRGARLFGGQRYRFPLHAFPGRCFNILLVSVERRARDVAYGMSALVTWHTTYETSLIPGQPGTVRCPGQQPSLGTRVGWGE